MCMSEMMLEELKVANELPCHSAKLSKTLTFLTSSIRLRSSRGHQKLTYSPSSRILFREVKMSSQLYCIVH